MIRLFLPLLDSSDIALVFEIGVSCVNRGRYDPHRDPPQAKLFSFWPRHPWATMRANSGANGSLQSARSALLLPSNMHHSDLWPGLSSLSQPTRVPALL